MLLSEAEVGICLVSLNRADVTVIMSLTPARNGSKGCKAFKVSDFVHSYFPCMDLQTNSLILYAVDVSALTLFGHRFIMTLSVNV